MNVLTTNPTRIGLRRQRAELIAIATTAMMIMTATTTVMAPTASARSLPKPSPGPIMATVAARIPAPAAPPANGRTLGGLTSQGWPIVMDIAHNGRSIAPIVVGVQMTCTDGSVFGVPDGMIHVPIASDGSVRATSVIAPSPGSPVSLTGGSRSLTGRLDRKHGTFSGAWQLSMGFQTSGGQTSECNSGRVRFRARL